MCARFLVSCSCILAYTKCFSELLPTNSYSPQTNNPLRTRSISEWTRHLICFKTNYANGVRLILKQSRPTLTTQSAMSAIEARPV